MAQEAARHREIRHDAVIVKLGTAIVSALAGTEVQPEQMAIDELPWEWTEEEIRKQQFMMLAQMRAMREDRIAIQKEREEQKRIYEENQKRVQAIKEARRKSKFHQ